MTSRSWPGAVAGAFFLIGHGALHASPQVVGDEACARYAVDIAAFATCEDGKVVRPAAMPDAGDAPAAAHRTWPDVHDDASTLARTLLALAYPSAAPQRGCPALPVQPR